MAYRMIDRIETWLHPHRPAPLRGLTAGLLGGLAGTVAMTAFQTIWSQTTRMLSEDGGDAVNSSNERQEESSRSATVQAADAIARGVLQTELSERHEQVSGQAVHFGFGTAMGGAYGVLAEYIPEITSAEGLPFGAVLMISADELAVPALGFSSSPTETPASTHLYGFAAHLVYGFTTETVRRTVRSML